MGNQLLNNDGTVASEGRRIHPDFPLVIAPEPIRELVSSLRLLHHQAADRAAYVLEALIRERTLTLALLETIQNGQSPDWDIAALRAEMGLRAEDPKPEPTEPSPYGKNDMGYGA